MSAELFGKRYETVGSSSAALLLKSSGTIKLQWGSKYIDLIKNGKLAVDSQKFFKIVDNESQIQDDGIYLTSDDEGVWISISGVKINLEGQNNYVSFLKEQDTSPEEKQQALRNIGFYYENLDEVPELTSGIIYNESDNKLYIIKDGQKLEYSMSKEEKVNNVFEEIFIGKIHIYDSSSGSTISGSEVIELYIDNTLVGSIYNNNVQLETDLSVNKIQSVGASPNSGFRLYKEKGKSTLEIDNLIVRNQKEQEDGDIVIYSSISNIITSVDLAEEETEETEETLLTFYLKYENLFKQGQKILVLVPNDNTLQIEEEKQDDSSVNISASIDRAISQQVDIKLTSNSQEIGTLTIPIGETDSNIINVSQELFEDLEYELVNRVSEIVMEGEPSKLTPQYLTVQEAESESIVVSTSIDSDLLVGRKIYSVDDPLIKIENNNLDVIEDGNITTRIGEVPYEEQKSGMYSNNFIGENSKLYGAIFKEDYPKYDMQAPTDFGDSKYDKVVPSIEWIKKLISDAVPSGTIAMYNGQAPIPDSWAICDGTNGTPNLIGRFIKASNVSGEIGGSDEIQLGLDNIPEHTHTFVSGTATTKPSGLHSHQYSKPRAGKSDNANDRLIAEFIEDGTTSSDGEHTHDIDMSSIILSKEGKSVPLKWEPKYYSLIYIMKK